MNRKWIYTIAATLILIALVVLLRNLDDASRSDKALVANEEATSQVRPETGRREDAVFVPEAPSSGELDADHKAGVQKGLEAIVVGLKQMGAKEVPPIASELEAAIASGDPGAMLRAFHEAIYGRFAKMSEAGPAIKVHLESRDPYVRYLAAESLLRIGDQSGVETLLKIVQNDKAVVRGGNDLRFAAARALAAFNAPGVAGSIRELYSKTNEGELLRSLSALGVQASEANSWQYVSSALAIENYAKERSTRFIPEISATFEQSKNFATKNTAAWALARMTGGDEYVNHLIEAARPAIEAASTAGGASFNESTEAVRYLGSLKSPVAVRALEESLDSQNPTVVRYATVNLLFNQPGGSEKAKQVVIRELHGQQRMLGLDLTMQIASQLDDPQVKAAAKDHDQRTGGDRWRYWGVERADWPIQNWIYDYVVALN